MSVGIVLPGGGARGAYEIGALTVLLPALAERGETVEVWCGASVGAINAAALASLAHLPVAEQVARGELLWRDLRKQDVIARLIGSGGIRMATRALGHALGIPGFGLASVLDPSPLADSLDRWIEWSQLAANVRSGQISSVCVVATALPAGRPVGFLSSRGEAPRRIDGEIRYVKTTLRGEHVRASAAIPVLFPTVEVSSPRTAAGHYTDGGARLNSPIKPALDLGASKLIVIGLEPLVRGRTDGTVGTPRAPGIADVAANVLDGLLVDQVAQDVRRMAAINSFFVESGSNGTIGASRTYRLARGHAPYRPISYALVAASKRARSAGSPRRRSPDATAGSRACGISTFR